MPYPNVALKTIRDRATDTLSLDLAMGNKVLEVSVNLSKVPTLDIIHLNKETGDILNTRLLKATIQVSKMEESKEKTLNDLRKVRVENKALKTQINSLQNEEMQMEGLAHKGSLAQKLLNDKKKEIQTLKKKLKIPTTQLAQAEELAEFEKEKEKLNVELTDFEAKLLKLREKEKQ